MAKSKRRKPIFDFDSLSPALKKLLPKVDAQVSAVFEYMESRAASMMRTNATWTDRTGNARNTLGAKHVATPMVRHQLILYHTMPYGIWLEVRWSGKYAVIGPTMIEISPDLSRLVAAAVYRATQ